MKDLNTEKLSPGVYRVDGEIWLDLGELVSALDWIDTFESRKAAGEVALEAMREDGVITADTKIVAACHRHKCGRCCARHLCRGEAEHCIKPRYVMCPPCRS